MSDGDDVASESGAGRPERRPARGRAESGPAASPETEALTISLPIELIDQVRQWASRNEIGLDEQIARLLDHALVLLRHKTRRIVCLIGRVQHGHRERRRVSAMMSRRLMVATEFGI